MSAKYDTKRVQDNLASYFDRSAAAVRQRLDGIERNYARPAVGYGLASFETHPITSTFVAIFSILSFLPVVSFIGFSLFIMASVSFVALSSAIIAIFAVEFVLASILLSAQAFILFLTFFLTIFAISTYLFVRFITLVRDQGRTGVREWALETKDHFLSKADLPPPREDESSVLFDHSRGDQHGRDLSDDGIKVEE